MYNPLYYLSGYYGGYQKSTVADYWRIRTGIAQSDTSLTTEVNLALALKNYGADVDFADNLGGRPYDGREHWGLCDELY